jgi:hypothetical protein
VARRVRGETPAGEDSRRGPGHGGDLRDAGSGFGGLDGCEQDIEVKVQLDAPHGPRGETVNEGLQSGRVVGVGFLLGGLGDDDRLGGAFDVGFGPAAVRDGVPMPVQGLADLVDPVGPFGEAGVDDGPRDLGVNLRTGIRDQGVKVEALGTAGEIVPGLFGTVIGLGAGLPLPFGQLAGLSGRIGQSDGGAVEPLGLFLCLTGLPVQLHEVFAFTIGVAGGEPRDPLFERQLLFT